MVAKTSKAVKGRSASVAKREAEKPAPRGRPKSEEPMDHVVQARVPQTLYEDLVLHAKHLRVPVSNLVRNILEDSVRMVENIVDGSLDIAQALARREAGFDPAGVAGWQPMIAAKRLACALCGRAIQKGEQSFLSVGAPDGRVHALCGECQCKL